MRLAGRTGRLLVSRWQATPAMPHLSSPRLASRVHPRLTGGSIPDLGAPCQPCPITGSTPIRACRTVTRQPRRACPSNPRRVFAAVPASSSRPSPAIPGCAVPAIPSARSDPDHACGPSGASRGHTSPSRPLAAAPSHAVPSLPCPIEPVPGGPPLPCLPLRINPFWPGLSSRVEPRQPRGSLAMPAQPIASAPGPSRLACPADPVLAFAALRLHACPASSCLVGPC